MACRKKDFMKNIAGVFDSEKECHAAVSKLLDAGFKKENLSLIVSDHARHTIFSSPVDDEGNRAARSGTAGALFGGALGTLVAGLTMIGAVTIPGSGIFVVGPLIGMLSGAGAGAAVGGLAGSLIGAGFAVDEAKHYEKEIQHGKAVIVVHAEDDMVQAARAVLLSGNAKIKAA